MMIRVLCANNSDADELVQLHSLTNAFVVRSLENRAVRLTLTILSNSLNSVCH